MQKNMKLVQAAASFALTGTGGSCSAVVDLVSVLKGLSIVLRVGVPGLDLIVRRSSFISFTRTVLIRFIESNLVASPSSRPWKGRWWLEVAGPGLEGGQVAVLRLHAAVCWPRNDYSIYPTHVNSL